jgi:hypothetical protein
VISDSFINSKKDKRTIKQSAFVNRIEKAHKKPLKRRRPNKKLVTNLESLGDVLGDIENASGFAVGEKTEGKIKQKTLKAGPGAMKRREKTERAERERFGKNMAQLIGSQTQTRAAGEEKMAVEDVEGRAQPATKTNTTSGRWAALRGFISQTLEQKEEFRKP